LVLKALCTHNASLHHGSRPHNMLLLLTRCSTAHKRHAAGAAANSTASTDAAECTPTLPLAYATHCMWTYTQPSGQTSCTWGPAAPAKHHLSAAGVLCSRCLLSAAHSRAQAACVALTSPDMQWGVGWVDTPLNKVAAHTPGHTAASRSLSSPGAAANCMRCDGANSRHVPRGWCR